MQKNKMFTILIAMLGDEDFREHINKEFHLFYTYFREMYQDAIETHSSWEEIIEDVVESEYAKPYIDLAYDELDTWYG